MKTLTKLAVYYFLAFSLIGCVPGVELLAAPKAGKGKQPKDTESPTTVTNLRATASSCSLASIRWGAATDVGSGVKYYQLFRNNTYLARISARKSSYSDSTVADNTSYSYHMVTLDGAGNRSLASTPATLQVPPCNEPPPPPDDPVAPVAASNLSAAPLSTSEISLQWRDNSNNETGFLIQRCKGANCTNFTTVATVGANSTSYVDKNLEEGETYCYRVIAIHLTLEAPPSNRVCTSTKTSTPDGWVFQFGTSLKDNPNVVARDAQGNLYTAGYTYGAWDGFTNQGSIDIMVSKVTAGGQLVWVKQIGTTTADNVRGLVVDDDGFIYLAGSISSDGLVIKLDRNGNEVWRDVIDPGSPVAYVTSIALGNDGNGAFLAIGGETSASFGSGTHSGARDPYVARYSLDGTQEWIETLTGSTEYERTTEVAIDSLGSIFISGMTGGSMPGHSNLGSADLYLAKYSSSGTLEWLNQYGYANYDSYGDIVIDSNDQIFVAGKTHRNILLARFNSDGSRAFLKQIDFGGSDALYNIALDSNSNIYGVGHSCTKGMFVQKYSSDGTPQRIWTRLGVPAVENISQNSGVGIVIGDDESITIGGSVQGAFPGFTNAGDKDFFLMKFYQ